MLPCRFVIAVLNVDSTYGGNRESFGGSGAAFSNFDASRSVIGLISLTLHRFSTVIVMTVLLTVPQELLTSTQYFVEVLRLGVVKVGELMLTGFVMSPLSPSYH